MAALMVVACFFVGCVFWFVFIAILAKLHYRCLLWGGPIIWDKGWEVAGVACDGWPRLGMGWTWGGKISRIF